MTVKQLKKMLKGVPDNVQVLCPLNGEFDGQFFSPCTEESGHVEMGLYESEEDEKEAKLLNKPVTSPTFILVPCGFTQITHEDEIRELN